MKITDRIKHAWKAFSFNQNEYNSSMLYGESSSTINYAGRSFYSIEALTAFVFNRIALDVAGCEFQHVKINKKNEDRERIYSHLDNCLNIEANIDQTGITFIHDLVYSMLDEGVVAVVPIEYEIGNNKDVPVVITNLRVGKILQWYPNHIRVKVYDETDGKKKEIICKKSNVAIIENPLYAVVNSPNATLQRLKNKLSASDKLDNDLISGKMNMIVQLPYALKTELQMKNARHRIEEIEEQLSNNRYGVAYIDSAEKITVLPRTLDNQMNSHIEYLVNKFLNEIGLTENVFNGSAKEEEMLIYHERAIDPIIKFIVSEFNRKFFGKKAVLKGHCIEAYKDVFKYTTVDKLATISDTFRRNYILTTNEVRTRMLKYKPSNDERADELFNPNIADSNQMQGGLPQVSDEQIDSLVDEALKSIEGGTNEEE